MAGYTDDISKIPHFSYLFLKEEKQFIVFDTIIQDSVTFENTITEHPIESGGSVTDHIRSLPTSYTLTAYVSNHPIFADGLNEGELSDFDNELKDVENGQPLTAGALLKSAGAALGGLFGFKPAYPVDSFKMTRFNDINYQSLVLSSLINAKNKGSIIEVDSAIGQVPLTNLVIQSLNPTRNGTTDILSINITLKEISLVSTKTVEIEEIKPEDLRGNEKKTKGRISPKKPENQSSILAKLGGF